MYLGFPGGWVVKNLSASTGDVGLIPGSGRPRGEGNGNPLQYSYLGNPVDREACWATARGVAELDTATKQQHLSSNYVPGNTVFHMGLVACHPPVSLPAALWQS